MPSDFRPFHGLRHSFASMPASSGQVDMYTLQKLLTHKSPLMTQRNAHRPLDAHILKQVREYFRIGMAYSSNALEGNSLTETETKIVIEDGITIGGKSVRDHLEALGHSEAYDLLFRLAKSHTQNNCSFMSGRSPYRLYRG